MRGLKHLNDIGRSMQSQLIDRNGHHDFRHSTAVWTEHISFSLRCTMLGLTYIGGILECIGSQWWLNGLLLDCVLKTRPIPLPWMVHHSLLRSLASGRRTNGPVIEKIRSHGWPIMHQKLNKLDGSLWQVKGFNELLTRLLGEN